MGKRTQRKLIGFVMRKLIEFTMNNQAAFSAILFFHEKTI